MSCSSYVCAGFETVSSVGDRFIKGEWFNDHFTREQVSHFLADNCDKFLHSFGQNFGKGKNHHKYAQREADLLKRCRDTGFFNDSKFIVDSGGFQISVGLLDKVQTENLFKIYYEFLVEHKDVYDRAFILDIPPGPGCKVYESFDDVYNLNHKSYETAANLPEEVRNKIIYIHHFRTPKVWEIYSRIMKENDLFGKFKYHGTGGIVANQSSDTEIPCIIYTIPLIPLLNNAIAHKWDTLNFHVLGGSTFRDILFYELFKIHIKKIHGVDVNITFDSSGIFKGLMVARWAYVLDIRDNIFRAIRKLDLRTEKLEQRSFDGQRSTLHVFRDALNAMASEYGFKNIPVDPIYSSDTGTFLEEIRIYSFFYVLHFFALVQEEMKKIAEKIYPVYSNNSASFSELLDLNTFGGILEQTTVGINQERKTKKQTAKSNSIVKSMEMLTNLDEDYCKYLVDKVLAKDEFLSLVKNSRTPAEI